jgi:hypothetical protein
MTNFISKTFTTAHFPNGPQTTDEKVLVFTDRVRGWQLDPALRCIRSDPHAGFAVLHIVVSYFEVVGMIEFDATTHSYLKKSSGGWESGREFKAGLMTVLPELSTQNSKHVRWFRNDFYKKVRCGLYHQSMTRSGILVSGQLAHQDGYEFLDLGNQGSAIIINPERLAQRLSEHLANFELRLRDPQNQQLRRQFEQVFAKLQ